MTFMDCIAAIQSSGFAAPKRNPPGPAYLAIGIVVAVLGLVGWVLIRAGKGRSSKK